jgi:hypothetical protein
VFRAVVRTVVPDAVALDQAGWNELEGLVLDSLSTRPPELRRRLDLFMRLVQWLPLFRYGRPFTSLSPRQRQRYLSGLQASRIPAIRLGFWGLRTMAFLGFYGRSQAAESIGYRPDRSGWEAVR